MNQPNTHPHQEIIIIKRKKVSHDGHHGGAWKIAYADFVTAMMAFFLVMWLINASNEETKAAVASYFNPVQLMDSTSNPKGIKDAKYGASSKDQPADSPKARSDARPATDDKNKPEKADEKIKSELDDNIFRDPYAVLAEIAGGAGRAEGGDISELPIESEGTPRPGLAGGEAYRDPFEPEFWSKAKKDVIITKAVPVEAAAVAPPVLETQLREIPVPEVKVAQIPVAETPISQPLKPEPMLDAKTAEEVIADDIQKTLADNPDVKNAPQIAVEAGDGTVTVNLTDGADYSMFELGSARPKREVIALVERIAAILNSKPGSIEIAGHTDARPFKSDNYDNWRLSSARAQMAYYMLVRAGVSSDRFSAIIGHSSAKLRIGEDPLAPQNRRIEITLITPKVVTP